MVNLSIFRISLRCTGINCGVKQPSSLNLLFLVIVPLINGCAHSADEAKQMIEKLQMANDRLSNNLLTQQNNQLTSEKFQLTKKVNQTNNELTTVKKSVEAEQ